MIDKKLIDKFVTAELVNSTNIRQGWIINAFEGTDIFIIKGTSGNLYVCEGNPVLVENPPKRNY